MIDECKTRDRRAGPRRGLLGTASALAMVGMSLVVAQPAFASGAIADVTITSDPTATTSPSQTGRRLDVTVAPLAADNSTATTGFDHFHITAVNNNSNIAQCDASSSPYTCVLTPLVAGTAYKIVVQTMNGSTVVATKSLDPGPTTTPKLSPPTSPMAAPTGASGDVKVSWTPDANVGGSTVAKYTASAYLGGSTAQATCQTTDGSASDCTIHGLVNGASYSFGVVANGTTPAADSVATDPTGVTAVPGVGSGAPTDAVATADNTALAGLVSWTPPTDTTGVTYTVAISPSTNSTPGPETCTSGGTATFSLCTNLVSGTLYTITVKASKNGVLSTAATATVRPTPAAPNDPASGTATVGDKQITATWTAPTTDNGVTIKGYRAMAYATGATTTVLGTCATTTAMTCDIKGLTNGVGYDVRVVAYGSTGSQSSATGTAIGSTNLIPAVQPKPSAPTVTTPGSADVTASTAMVSWTPAGAVSGAAVAYYTATATVHAASSASDDSGAADASNPSCTAVAPQTSCTITGLLPGTHYDVKVIAYASPTSFSTAGTVSISTPGSSTPSGGGMSGPIVTNRAGLSQMFARGGDSNLWTNVRDANGNWGQWTSLGGLIGSEPVAVLNGSGSTGRLQVFVLGYADHAVWTRLQNANDTGFGPWMQVDGSRWISKIELTKNKAGTLQIFGRGADNNLYYTVQTSATDPSMWQPWTTLGGLITSDPVVAQWDDGTLEVFAVGAGDGQIWHRWQAHAGDNTSWAWWAHVAPTAASNVSL